MIITQNRIMPAFIEIVPLIIQMTRINHFELCNLFINHPLFHHRYFLLSVLLSAFGFLYILQRNSPTSKSTIAKAAGYLLLSLL
jgi:hypothetical protein